MLDISLGKVVREQGGLYRVGYPGIRVLWAPRSYGHSKRVLWFVQTCRKLDTVMLKLRCIDLGAYCMWDGMVVDVAEFVWQH